MSLSDVFKLLLGCSFKEQLTSIPDKSNGQTDSSCQKIEECLEKESNPSSQEAISSRHMPTYAHSKNGCLDNTRHKFSHNADLSNYKELGKFVDHDHAMDQTDSSGQLNSNVLTDCFGNVVDECLIESLRGHFNDGLAIEKQQKSVSFITAQGELYSAIDVLKSALRLSKELQEDASAFTALSFTTTSYKDFMIALLACAMLNKDTLLVPKADEYEFDDEAFVFDQDYIAKALRKLDTDLGAKTPSDKIKDGDCVPLCAQRVNEQSLSNRSVLSDKEIESLKAVGHYDSKIIVYTSGSSGKPKRVIKTLSLMLKEAKLFSMKHKVDNASLLITTVSPFHLYGLTFCVFMPLYNGMCVYDERIVIPEDLRQFRDFPCTFVSSPSFLKYVDYSFDWPKIVMTLSAGGVLTDEVANHYVKGSSCKIIDIYGSSETGIVASRLMGNGGSAFEPFAELSLVPCDDYTLLTSPIIYEGTFKLDDKISFVDGSNFVILGRKDRVVKLGDKRVNLGDIESKIMSHPQVKDVVVFVHRKDVAQSEPLSRMARTACLIAVDSPEKYQDHSKKRQFIAELKSLLKTSFDPVGIPRSWRFCDSIPVNHMGKRSLDLIITLFD